MINIYTEDELRSWYKLWKTIEKTSLKNSREHKAATESINGIEKLFRTNNLTLNA